jgi:hypothetical protein
MATQKSHILLANRNERTLEYLIERAEDHPEWIANVSFYKAVHVVEPVLAGMGFHSESHAVRLGKLKHPPFHRDAYGHFRVLWQSSLIARYLNDDAGHSFTCFTDYMPADKVVAKLVRRRLKPLEDLLINMISEGNRSQLHRVPADTPS